MDTFNIACYYQKQITLFRRQDLYLSSSVRPGAGIDDKSPSDMEDIDGFVYKKVFYTQY